MKQIYIALLFLVFQFGFANVLAPSATISGNATVCQNAPGVVITFTGSGGTAPYVFTYHIGTGGPITVPSVGNTAVVNVNTSTPGTFVYYLDSVHDAVTPAEQPSTGTVTVTVNAPPTVDFNFNNNATCSGTTVLFTPSVIGSGSYTYSWDFGDSTALSSAVNPTHVFTSLGCGTTNFTVTLTITGGGCTVTRSHTINVKDKPDISFNDPNASSSANQFNNCAVASLTNTSYSITVENTSNSVSCITSYSINWGDSSSQNNITFPISHTYTQLGVYNMVITAIGNFGCSNSISYTVKNISNPSAGVLNPGGTVDMCIPTPIIQYTIGNWAQNSPGTTYAVNYGDNSPILNIDQATMVASPYYNAANPLLSANYPIPYSYTTVSCPGEFTITLVVTNACRSTTGTVVGGNTRSKPIANFTNPAIGCVTSSVLFSNTTILGYDTGCIRDTKFSWNFGDPASGANNTITTGWVTSPTNANHLFSGPGVYTVTLTAQSGCGTTTKTQQICIESPLVPLFTINNNSGCTPFTVSPDNTTILTNSCPGNPTYQWNITYTSGFCGSTPGIWNYTSGDGTSAEPIFNFVTPGNYSISLTTINSCGTVTSAVQTVTVKKPPTVTSINGVNAGYCGTATLNPTATVNSCAPSSSTLTYAWSFPGGNPATSSAVSPGPIGYPAGGPYTISLVVSNECGASSTATQIFSVNTAPTLTNTNLSQTICSGSATTAVNLTATPAGTTFSWTASATPGVTGFLASGAANTIPAQTITTTGVTPGTVTYVITPTSGVCSGTPVNYVVTVNPAPAITTQPASSSVCLGGTPTALTVGLNSSSVTPAYQWYSNTTSSTSGGTLIPGAVNATFNPPSATAGTLYYYCVISLSSGGCSGLTSTVAGVTINPLPTVSTQPMVTQTICVGGAINALTISYTGGVGTATYQWYSNGTSATTGGTAVGTNASSYTPPVFNTPGTYYYYAVITLSGYGCNSVTTTAAEIVVVGDPTLTSQPLPTQTLCQNSLSTDLTVVATGGTGTFTYQWYTNPNNTTPSGTPIAGATTASYTPPTNLVGTKYYYCIVSQTGLGCAVTSSIATVIVNASPTIQNQPASSTVCLGGTPSTLSLTYTNGVGTPSYQWYSNTTNATTGGTLLTGETNPTYTPPSTTVGTLYYYAVVTFSSISGSCAVITTNTATVTIDPGATITQQPPANQSLCVGATLTAPLAILFSGGTGTPTYQWYSNTTNTTVGGVPVGSNAPNYIPPVFTTPGSYYYYVVISLNGSGCGNVTSAIAQVDVQPDPVITAQPSATQTKCQNSAADPLTVAVSGGIGTFNYQWYSNTNPSNSGGTIISGAVANSFVPPTTSIGTTYYYCDVSQIGLGCGITSAFSTVIVVPAPIITLQPQSETVCAGAALTPLTVSYTNGTGTASYQWYDDNGIISGATSATYTPINALTANFYCIITFSLGGCTSITSNTATVSIIAVPSISQQPTPAQNICTGGSVPPLSVNYVGGVGTVSYQWYSNSVNATSGGTPVGTNSSTYTPPVLTAAGTYYYYVTLSFSGSGCGSITSTVAQVDVVNDPVVTNQPLISQTVCQNSPPAALSVAVSGGIGTTYSYQWYSSATNSTSTGTPISGANSATYSPPTTTAGTFYYYCLISQAGVGCDATSAVATVIVNLAPVITAQPTGSVVCVGDTTTVLSFTYSNGVGTPTYQWYSNSVNLNTGGTLITGAVGATYNPSSAVSGTTYYYGVITFPSLSGGCSIITTDAIAITVNDNPIIAAEATTICSNNAFLISPMAGGANIIPLGTTYTWTAPVINPLGAVTGAIAQNIPQSTISQNLINTTTSPATVTYTVIPTSGVCIGNSFTVTVTVNPSINPNVVAINNACFGVNIASITTNITGGIPPYSISWTGPGGYTSAAVSISNLVPGVYNLLINDLGNCPYINSYTITEPTDIAITVDSENDISCYTANNGSISITVTGGTGSYGYTWTKGGNAYATTEDISNLGPGNYVVSVTDANNCGPRTMSFTITEPPLLVVTLVSQTNVLCYGAATGAISTSVSGGTPGSGYSFVWTGPGGFTSAAQNLVGTPAGTYDLTVTDANGCIKNLSVVITQSTDIVIAYTTTPITCYGANNASLAVTLSGGNPPYQFQWSNLSTSLTQTNLSAGSYTITVTDNVGCIKTETIVIPQAPIFTVNPIVTNVTCHGLNNGSINLNLTGGIAPVALSWSDGSTAGLIRNNLAPGSYTATISDGTPCYIVRSFTIVEPAALVVSANLTNAINCTNPSSGAIDLVVAGGTLPYTFSWSNGASSEDLTALTSGNYSVTVTDANGCTANAQFPITRPAPILITVATETDFDCAAHTVDQSFVAQVSGGIPPIQLQWSSGTVSGANNEIMQTSTNGTVLLTATDSNSCTATYSLTVATPTLGYSSFDTTSYGFTTYGLYAIGDPIQFQSNITGDYISVSWDFGDGTFSTDVNPVHTYLIPKDYIVTQTVTYPFGCVYVQTISLLVEKGYVLVVPTAFTPNNDTVNDTYRPVTKGLKNVVLDIYDTWGSLIYSEKGDVLVGWDAKIKGFNAENGNYYSKVRAETFYGTIVNADQTFVLIK